MSFPRHYFVAITRTTADCFLLMFATVSTACSGRLTLIMRAEVRLWLTVGHGLFQTCSEILYLRSAQAVEHRRHKASSANMSVRKINIQDVINIHTYSHISTVYLHTINTVSFCITIACVHQLLIGKKNQVYPLSSNATLK